MGIAVFLVFLILYEEFWILRHATYHVTDRGILVYDARRQSDRGYFEGYSIKQMVDDAYETMQRCIPFITTEDAYKMRQVSIVIRSGPLYKYVWFGPEWGGKYLYYSPWGRFHVVDMWSIQHEWVHHYLSRNPLRGDFWRDAFKDPSTLFWLQRSSFFHSHPLFEQCEYYRTHPETLLL